VAYFFGPLCTVCVSAMLLCRYPLPNHYTITLEVSRDRTTAAYHFVCDSTNPIKPNCPSPLQDGDTYLYRSLNEPCDKTVCISQSAFLSYV